jgi:hypothetical protein
LTRLTQPVPDLRWTHTARETTPGSFPEALTISAAIALEGASSMYGVWAVITREGEITDAAPCQGHPTPRYVKFPTPARLV